MPRHIFRLVLLLVVFAVAAYSAKQYFTVASFYEYGHYRGNAVADIAAEKPKFKGPAYCESCHAEQFAVWSKSIHNSADVGKVVKCEVCHGAAGGRDVNNSFTPVSTGPDHPKGLKLSVPTDTRKLCTLCHEKMAGRPAQQPQIVVADHAGTQQCITCHNPHSPKIEVAAPAASAHPGDAAAGKANAEACAGCHGADGVSAGLPGPTLAGQNEAYIVGALKAYKSGGRDVAMMTGMVESVDDDGLSNLAAYFSGLKCESALDAGKQSASANRAAASKCAACHGPDGHGTNRAFPNLVGQSKDYLINALNAYKAGDRKNVMMSGVAKGLSDADVEAAASYYADATCK